MLPRQFNANPPKPRRKSVAKKRDFEALPLKVQLQIVMAKFDDPLTEVISLLDPFHEKIIRPEVRPNPNIPDDPNYGLFRVIFWARDDDGTKFHTTVVKAKDGFDARSIVETEFVELESKRLLKVVGVECVCVPKKYIWKINDDFPVFEQKGLIKVQAELEKSEIVNKLEAFETDQPHPDLSQFLGQEQSEQNK